MAKLFAYFNHKRAFPIIKKEVYENDLYKSLFIAKPEENKAEKVDKETKVATNKVLSL